MFKAKERLTILEESRPLKRTTLLFYMLLNTTFTVQKSLVYTNWTDMSTCSIVNTVNAKAIVIIIVISGTRTPFNQIMITIR